MSKQVQTAKVRPGQDPGGKSPAALAFTCLTLLLGPVAITAVGLLVWSAIDHTEEPPPVAPDPVPPVAPVPAPSHVAPPSPDLTALADTPTPMTFKAIPGGTFTMGSPTSEEGRDSDETQHEVTVSPFWIGETEVTQAQYKALVGTTPSSAKYESVSLIGDTLPVQNISWYDAVKLANALSEKEGLRPIYVISGTNVSWSDQGDGYRLPTEAEWEYAARAGSKEARTGAASEKETCKVGNARDASASAKLDLNSGFPCDDGYPGLAPVQSFAPNAFGLCDTLGNVWEWTWDWYGTYGSDPRGASGGGRRVIRGGSWYSSPANVRVANRNNGSPDFADNFLGVRLARSAPVSPPAGP